MIPIEIKPCEGGLEVVVRQFPDDVNSLINDLRSFSNVVRICLMQPVHDLANFNFLQGVDSLQRLHVNFARENTNYSVLKSLPCLQEITTGDRCWFDCSILPHVENLSVFRSGPLASSLSEIRACKKLQWLELSGIRARDCSFVAGMSTLKRLRLWDCQIKLTKGINLCPNIEDLSLGRSSVVELADLVGLPRLTAVTLEYCSKIKDPSPLLECSSLTFLNISHCTFEVDSNLIFALSNLNTLAAIGVTFREEAIDALVKHTLLRTLRISRKYSNRFAQQDTKCCIHYY